MQTLEATKVNVSEESLPDFSSEKYKDAYSRINAIVIEGEKEAHDNYLAIGTLIPDKADELKKLAIMEMKHMKGFTACGKNLGVQADMPFAKEFFEPLHSNFQKAFDQGNLTTCFLIQAILIEAFAISAYHVYIRVADPFAKKITENVVKDEYLHLNYGQEWLKANLSSCKEDLIKANKQNLPLIKSMLDQVTDDAKSLDMDKEELMEEFMIAYQDSLVEIGLDSREIARMALAALV
ncbi:MULTISPECIES: aldehyde oxygenase (deformylating) [unclassified Prochlorococcus]|uniref:aldehyde oxygenase (deformylating) n=1 Tax=unclassified Prochlorococcus TaxID=2627481 RepID=UPI000533A6F7|nr:MULTISPECIES: aldehyde oxygenase (deformylating) [unclassified Prochlorococcus]KGG16426.1 Aldehyde decarbonylase [Prochlorococcus sp. MIT 0602]KGG17100.1 Aldehyde decarbonylase [Prochlorococcus sp. MIT 0603]